MTAVEHGQFIPSAEEWHHLMTHQVYDCVAYPVIVCDHILPGHPLAVAMNQVHKKGIVYLFHKDKNEIFVHPNHENRPFWSIIMYFLPMLACAFLLFCTADQLIVDQEFF
jgi:hypothetical protein